MKVTLISHASVLIETPDCTIWTDPWLFGKAFMDSWSLLIKAHWDETWYDQVDYVWISHEHPDHFHIPTLKSMPQSFKSRVTLLFQQNNSDKIPNFLRELGFKNIKLLKHREFFPLQGETSVYIYQVGAVPDSALAVMAENYTLLNINDCEVNTNDCKKLVKDLRKINLVLNQFSAAAYRGHIDYKTYLQKQADLILENLIRNHLDLNADYTIPIASFIYFSDEDNRYVNEFANTPLDVVNIFNQHALNSAVLYPGDTFDSEIIYDSEPALLKYKQIYENLEYLEYRKPKIVSLEQIKEAHQNKALQLKEKYPKWLLKKLKPLRVWLPDLNQTVQICLLNGRFKVIEGDFDLKMNSEALYYALSTAWGVSTISVAAKYLIKYKQDVWRWYKIINTLNNAEFYLKLQYLFTKKNYQFIISRLNGGFNQLRHRWKIMNV